MRTQGPKTAVTAIELSAVKQVFLNFFFSCLFLLSTHKAFIPKLDSPVITIIKLNARRQTKKNEWFSSYKREEEENGDHLMVCDLKD